MSLGGCCAGASSLSRERPLGSTAGGECREADYVPRGKRPRKALVPPGNDPGKNTEKVGLGHPWAEER